MQRPLNRRQLYNKTLSEIVGECGNEFMNMYYWTRHKGDTARYYCDRPSGHTGAHSALRLNRALGKNVRFYWKMGYDKPKLPDEQK